MRWRPSHEWWAIFWVFAFSVAIAIALVLLRHSLAEKQSHLCAFVRQLAIVLYDHGIDVGKIDC